MKKLFTLLLFTLALPVVGANHYVRSAATGSNNGADWNNAYTDLPSSMTRGDLYYVAGGTYGHHNFADSASGTTVIEVRYATPGDHGTSTGWSDSFANSQALFTTTSGTETWVFNQPYYLFNGVVRTINANDGTPTAQGIKVWQQNDSTHNQATIFQESGGLPQQGNLTFTNIEIQGACYNNNCQGQGCVFFGGNSSWPNQKFQYCYIHDGTEWITHSSSASNLLIEHCFFQRGGSGNSANHATGIFCENQSGTLNQVIRYNVFDSMAFGETSYIEIWGGSSYSGVDIYGNVFRALADPTHEGCAQSVIGESNGQVVNNCHIYNNTFYGLHAGPFPPNNSKLFFDNGGSGNLASNNLWQANFSPGNLSGSISGGDNTFNGSYSLVNPTAGNVRLLAQTAQGQPVASPYNIDPDGNTRGFPSIGAYEFVGAGPSITSNPTNITVNCGSTATFYVSASSAAPPLTYQWYKNPPSGGSSAISGATSTSYTTPAVSGTDNGSGYHCVATDANGSTASGTAILTVELISGQPSGVTINAGQSATFSVTTFSCGTVTYSWTRNGTTISGANSSSYTLANCQTTDSGSVFACNIGVVGASETSANATLTVNGPPLTYYVSPTGNSGNTGLSTSSPWDLITATQRSGDSNTVYLMDGDYVGLYPVITNQWVTYKALNKWKPRLRDFPNRGFAVLNSGIIGNGLTLDGIQISNGVKNCILLWAGTNHTIRNCWLQGAGKLSPGGSQGDCNGINLVSCNNCLIEDNLIELNGIHTNFDHGLYFAGTNGIIRNNVIRYNQALGLNGYDGTPANVHLWKIYNNLIYLNGTGGQRQDDCSIYGAYGSANCTNWIFNNIIVSRTNWCIETYNQFNGAFYVTNNIFISLTDGIDHSSTTTYADYNLAPRALFIAGPHDVVNANVAAYFVNTNKGLYWPANGSPAIGKALATIYGAVDWFGNVPTNWPDIGPYAYSSIYAADTRTLDPSGSGDYWTNLPSAGGTAPVFTLQPVSQTIADGGSATFTVTATGTAPLSYQWAYGGVNLAGATTSSYTTNGTVYASSGTLYSCGVTNAYGGVISTNATLTVTAVAPTFNSQPANASVYVGQNALFSVQALGTVPLAYRWNLGGVAIAGATNSSLATNGVVQAASGNVYSCVVTNIAGTNTSANATLTVLNLSGLNLNVSIMTVTNMHIGP